MKTKRKAKRWRPLILSTGFLVMAHGVQAQGHWFAGAFNTNQNGKLMEYTNAGSFVADSGYVYWLTYTNGGNYSNLYNGSSPTFTALGNGTTVEDSGSGSPLAAATGAYLWNNVVSLDGPVGGHFYFYDVDIYHTTHTLTNSPTYVIGVGSGLSNYLFALSDPANGAGVPGGDPYGHLHGRRYAVDKPGTYTLGLQILDLSTNGAGGGPIQTTSDVYYATFQAGNLINSVALNSNGANVRFPTLASIANALGQNTNAIYALEATTNVTNSGAWTLVGTNVGTSYFQTLTDSNSADSKFYRLKITARGDAN